MRFRIFFVTTDKTGKEHQDSVVISGTSLEEVRKRASEEVTKRGASVYWSEEIK